MLANRLRTSPRQGLDGSGKTTLINWMAGKPPPHGFTCGSTVTAVGTGSSNVRVRFADIGGQLLLWRPRAAPPHALRPSGRSSMRHIWKRHYPWAQAVVRLLTGAALQPRLTMRECVCVCVQVFVVDCSDRARLAEAGIELQLLVSDEALVGKPLLVLAHKQDLLHAMPPREVRLPPTHRLRPPPSCRIDTLQVVDGLNLHAIRDHTWFLQPTSVATGEGVQAGMQWLLSAVGQQRAR